MEIDPALLSVVCRELNNKRRESIPPLPRITAELMAGADREILKGFYERGMEGLNPGVRRFVEEELITQQGYRDSHDWEDALLLPGVTQLGLEQLITRRLLRGDERQGRRRLELTHDVLAKVVKDSRDNRRDREAEAAKAQERLAAAERERAAETAKGLRTTQRLLALSGMLGVCLVLIGGFAIRQSKQAQAVEKKARQVAEQNTQEAKKLADRLAATNKDLAKQKQAADQLANKLKQALELAAQREQLAIAASKRAEAEKVQADAQRKIAEQQQMKAEVAKLRVEKALKYADQQRRRANEEAQKAEDARLKLEAFKFLQTWEGMLLKPARFPTNEILIGVGHMIDEKECPSGQVKIDGACLSYANGINEQQAFRLLSADLEKTIRHLAQTFKANLNSNQRLALLSFVFNMGTYSENYPTLIKAVNEGRLDEVPKALMIYVEKGSPFEAGLRRRRQAEADLWNTPPNQSN
jgi:GH24 family phage-related lysozyme (muramidase)